MKMLVKINDKVITVALTDTETTKDFVSHLPLTLTLNEMFDREYTCILDFVPSLNGESIPDFSHGDVTYFPKVGSLAFFFKNEEQTHLEGLLKLGSVVDGLDLFGTFNGEDVTAYLSVEE